MGTGSYCSWQYWSRVNILYPVFLPLIYLSLIKSLPIKDNAWSIWCHGVQWMMLQSRQQDENPRKWFSVVCLLSDRQIELLWKTHFPLKIRTWLPHTSVSRILRAVVSLSNLHDEYISICFSLCLNSILYWQTRVACTNNFHVAYQSMNNHFYNPEEMVECTWNKPSKQMSC